MNATIRETIETIALAVVIFFLLQTTVQNYRVRGSSMEPQLTDQQLVLVNKVVYLSVDLNHASRYLPWLDPEQGEEWFLFHPPSRGDVVVFKNPINPSGADFVKRVIGEPGETVEIVRGQVFVNGAALEEPYVTRPGSGSYPSAVVGPGQYFVLGDNRVQSEDSRFFGTVPRETVIGRVWVEYWPLERFSLLGLRWGW